MTRIASPAPLGVDDMLCFAAYSASLAFNRLYKPMLERMGLTYPQLLAMSLLWEQDDRTVGQIGERLFLETNTVTPLIKRLEAAGLVTRTRARDDERVVRVRLTDAGRALASEAGCLPEAVLDASGMTPEALGEMTRALGGLRDRLRAAA
ncbi:MarR family winged helix-turn-helix transcriptional regulator [Brevundimonas sp.]|uniref:MarR family winged helix-turn-helix transcriptional regulator n=1 Tax=Brevundimonas sp. TaxID=1871086 RepID=UPI0035B29856